MSPKNPFGTRPSRASASMTRGWLSIITSRTEVIPVIAPAATRYCIHVRPTRLNASTTGASMLISAVLTGMVPSSEINIDAPVVDVDLRRGHHAGEHGGNGDIQHRADDEG